MAEKFYLTTAIAYTSRKPHIGNTYEIVLSDAIARYKRQRGYDVYFLTGTDEHGIKIQEIAESENITPKEYVDKVAGEIKTIWDLMNSSYSKFIRTTDDYHVETVQKIFKKFYDQGDIYKGHYEGMYCVPCETFYTESQLVHGKCPDCGREVKPAKEEAYFFKMSKYQDALMKHIEENPEFIQPESRKKEMVNNFLKPGLQDLCVSRTSFTWGVPVTFDEKHVVYVWIDALSNYITALGYNPENPDASELFNKNWPADVHIIGKDILRFHTIYWPIMLMALGLPLPKKVFGHPWLLSGNDKMSKSKGNVIYADDLVEQFGVDAIRFYLLNEMPYANDGTITYETIIARYNSELANVLGNLVNRTIAMNKKYFGGIVQNPSAKDALDDELVSVAMETVKNVKIKMDEYKTADALSEIWTLLKRSNKYIDETTPWALAKDEANKERLGTVLYNLLETIRIASVLLEPFMPETAEKIQKQINTDVTSYDSLDAFGGYKAGTETNEAEPLFVRLDEEKKMEEIAKAIDEKMASEENYEPLREEISIDDFDKLDLRVAKVISCEEVKKSEKLLKFELDLGFEKRTILSGIKKWYTPEEMVGKNLIIIANLKPRKMMGIESKGMILSAFTDDELTALTTIKDIKPGSVVG